MTGRGSTFRQLVSDVPLILGDALEGWLIPRLTPIARSAGLTVAEEVRRRVRDQKLHVTNDRPLKDCAVSLRYLQGAAGLLDVSAEVPQLAGSVLAFRNASAHGGVESLNEAIRGLEDSARLLQALGAGAPAEVLASRRDALRRQTDHFPFPQAKGRWQSRTLFVVPCSAHKVKFPDTSRPDPGPHDVLRELRRSGAEAAAAALASGRKEVARRAGVDVQACGLLPAFERYSEGTLWNSGGRPRADLRRAVERGAHVCIISGAYGLLHALEPIGYYDIEIADAGWTKDVLQEALAAYACALGVTRVVGLLRTPAYRRVVEDAYWRAPVKDVDILVPERPDGPVSSDGVLGEALERLLAPPGRIDPAWQGSDGAMLTRIHRPIRG